MIPMTTILQLAMSEWRISDVLGLCFRATNSSVSWRDRLSLKRNGMIAQPRSKGTRHPQSAILIRRQNRAKHDSHKRRDHDGHLLAPRLPTDIETLVAGRCDLRQIN